MYVLEYKCMRMGDVYSVVHGVVAIVWVVQRFYELT